MGCNPRAVIRQVGGSRRGDRERQGRRDVRHPGEAEAAQACARAAVRDGLAVGRARDEEVSRRSRVPGLPRFTGGAVGFIGYEFIHDVEPVVPRPPHDDLQTPMIYFLIADQLLIFDRVAQTITVLVNAVLDDAASPAEAYENATERNRPAHLPARTTDRAPPGDACPRSAAAALRVEPAQGEVPGQRPQGQAIHHRGRHHPGRRLPALLHAGQGLAAGHLPRRPLHQPVALHVPARTGRVLAGRRLAGNPRPLRGPQGRDSPHRRHAPPRGDAGGGPRPREGTARRPQGARRARHAGGPGPQRPGPRLRFRHRAGEGPHDHRALQPRHAHRVAGRRAAFRGARRRTI